MSIIKHLVIGSACLAMPLILTTTWQVSAAHRLAQAAGQPGELDQVAVAQAADAGYCSQDLRKILRRVLTSCGLLASGEVRGCQPLEARSLATMNGDDFNALFMPLADRAGIIQYDMDSDVLDAADVALLDKVFSDQRGASYFFVVARSSPEGSAVHNRDLSQRRGKAVLDHLRQSFGDQDLEREVGLLWLGEEYAQLDKDFCAWQRSGTPEECSSKDLNRSAFLAWIDCRI